MHSDLALNIHELARWAWRYARRFPAALVAVLLCMGAQVVLSLLKPWPMAFLVDHVLRAQAMPGWLAAAVQTLPGSDRPMGLAAWCIGTTIVIFLLEWLCALSMRYANVTLAQRVTYEVAADLFRRFQQLSLLFHTRRSTGDSLRRVTADCGAIAMILRDGLLPILGSVATLIAMLAIMWRLNIGMTLIAVLVAPCMALVFRLYARVMLERSYVESQAEARIYEVVEQTFSAMPAVKAFGREPLAQERLQVATESTLKAALGLLSVQLQFKILIGLATALGTAAMIWIGTGAVIRQEMTLGTMLLFLSYLASLYAPIEAIMYTGSTIQAAGGGARRVLEILHTEPQVADRPHAIRLPRATGQVRFEDVSFAYEDRHPILRGVSLDVAAGETVALVGPTGAGKTTLVSLIPRFFDPTHGRVLIDGHDLRNVRLATLRSQVALVLQEPFLFPVTIADNIAYGQPGASREEIEAAARAANAHAFVAQLPEGYDTVVGERGATLSGGERQRISIARAILKQAPILILDEPTSALDADTEGLVMQALHNLTRGRTTFIIAHRLTTVRHAHRILVLNDGAIIESGTHDQLAARGGLYASYLTLQLLG